MNKRWNQIYVKIFHILEAFVKAYSQHPNSTLSSFEFPVFPSKLISKEAFHYFCKIQFRNRIFLYVSLHVTSANNRDTLPEINFSFNKNDKKLEESLFSGEFSLVSDLDIIIKENKLIVSKKQNNSNIDREKSTCPLPQSEEEWEKRLRGVVEYLIIKAESFY